MQTLKGVKGTCTSILSSAKRNFNIDEVKKPSIIGQKENLIGATGRNCGERLGKQGYEKHVTSVLTINSAGDNRPVQLNVEGRLELKRW